MAEGALFSLASKVLSTIASPAFEKAYEGGQLICGAKEELERLKTTIESIHAVLLDAERKQEDSLSVKNWVKRVRGVLYDADDLFDEIATADLLKKQMKGNKLLKKVHVFFSELNPIVSRYFISTRVKDIRKSLTQISEDMGSFKFVRCLKEEVVFGGGRRVETGSFVDPKDVIGRTAEKEAIEGFLFSESDAEQSIPSVAVVGIGGMGKTTLAQLVYNDEEVQKRFEKKWWACISDTVDDKEVIGKIFQSITGNSYQNMQMTQLESGIRQSVSESGSFLLVLDDVWDEDHARWMNRMSLLSSGAMGSRIIVTTRSSSVARAMDACWVRSLNGLSEDESWKLFERFAFSEEKKDNPMWISLGREIVKKCSNVPLAIKCIASTLYTKCTLEEWIFFKNDELSKIELSDNPTMSALKLSYDHLSSNLKQCFAYCSLYPKDCEIDKQRLIYLWIAQGYIESANEKQSVEEIGHAYFMELLRRSFFQEVSFGFSKYKMHDLMHELAQHVSEDETTCLSGRPSRFSKNVRHISIIGEVDASWEIPAPLLSVSQPHSLLFMVGGSLSTQCLDRQFTKFKVLRALHLQRQNITEVPNSIGELKHLRCLDLSMNKFKYLPNSIGKLVNLLSLDISLCGELEAWPNDFRKLFNLRHLNNVYCKSLQQMPVGFGELTSLQNLSEFIVGKVDCNGGINSGLGSLARLMLRGVLTIQFRNVENCWERDECWELPATIDTLYICDYPGIRIPSWGGSGSSFTPNIVELSLWGCSKVTHLPPLRDLPYLEELCLGLMDELEYAEEKESTIATESSVSLIFFPRLMRLKLLYMKRLKGWSRKAEATMTSSEEIVANEVEADAEPSFPLLSELSIYRCPELKSMPTCPRLCKLELSNTKEELIPLVLSKCLHSLHTLEIGFYDGLVTLSCEALASLRCLELNHCSKLRNVKLAPPSLNPLERLSIELCKELELWDEEKRGMDWDSLPNLRELVLWSTPRPSTEMLPYCLRQRQASGLLNISHPYIPPCP